MSLLTQRIANLLGGVSQRPDPQRSPSQAEEQINALSNVTRGVMKRPPTVMLGKLTSTVDGLDTAFIHTINRDEDERFHVVVADGDVKVYNAVTAAEVPVIAPGGTAYLEDPDGFGFRAVTVGDTTLLVNRGIKALKGTKTAPDVRHEALLYVRQADFSTTYRVTLNGTTVAIQTVDMDAPASRQGISTDLIAEDLETALRGSSGLGGFSFTRLGSTIHVIRSDGADFTLSVSDGLSDNGLKAIKGTVQAFEELPARAVKDFVVEVIGDIDTAKDNFWVRYDDLGDPGKQGVWREAPKPGTLLDLDESTLPHRLVLQGEVGTRPLPNQGLQTNGGVISPFRSGQQPASWATFQLPTSTDPKRTQQHGGGATITAALSLPFFEAPHQILDLRNLEPLGVVYARLYKNGVKVDEIRYQNAVVNQPFNPVGQNANIPGSLTTGNVIAGDVLSIRLEYEGGATPPAPFRATMLSSSPSFWDSIGTEVAVGPLQGGDGVGFFPIGTTITLNVDGNILTSTVTNEAERDVGSVTNDLLLKVLALGSAFEQAGSLVLPDKFFLRRADKTAPTVTISATLSSLIFANNELALVPGAQVGRVFTNVTDGSSGIITANTAQTITVGSLTGGADNQIQPGDVGAIFADPGVGTHFVFSPVPWNERKAGDVDVVTFPSFIGSRISDVFFYQNRIGLLSKENIVMSSAGDLFNLFRYTATDFRPDDAIDVRSAHADVTIFDSAFLWSGGLYVKSDNVWFRVSGDPALTPTTIRLDPVGRYPSSPDPRPVVIGERVYFTRAKTETTQVFELTLDQQGTQSRALDITKDLPTFVKGTPIALAGDGAEGLLFLLTEE